MTASVIRRWPAELTHSIAFADDRFGAAVLVDGRVKVTSDGGRTERVVDLGAVAARGVRLVNGALVIDTSAAQREVLRDGSHRDTTLVPSDPQLSHEQQWALLTALARRWPRSITADSLSTTLARDTLIGFGRSIVRFDGRSGRVLSTHPGALPSARCEVSAWGPRARVLCADRRFDAVWSAEDGLRASPFSSPHASYLFSNDGLHAAVTEPCEQFLRIAATDSMQSLCSLSESGRWRNALHQPVRGRLVAVRDEVALIEDFAADRSRLLMVDLDRSTASALEVPPATAQLPTIHDSGLAEDHTAWAVFESRVFTDPAVFVRWIRGVARTVALPARVVTAIALDARRTFALGETGAEFWTLDRDEQSWSQNPLAVRGNPAELLLAPTLATPLVLSCNAQGCLANNLWVSDDAVPDGDVVVMPPARAIAGSASYSSATPENVAIECAPDGPRSAVLTESKGAAWGRYELSTHTLSSATVELSVAWVVDSAPSRVHRARAEVRLRETSAFVEAVPSQGWRIAHASDRFALIERCVNGAGSYTCDRFVARAGGIAPMDSVGSSGAVHAALARDNGSVVLRVGPSRSDGFLSFAMLDRDGAVRATHALAPMPGRWTRALIATRGAQSGFAVQPSGDRRDWFSMVVLFDEMQAISPRVERFDVPANSEVVGCAGPRDRAAITLLGSRYGSNFDVRLSLSQNERADDSGQYFVFEVTPSGRACVRSVFQQTPPGSLRSFERSADGALVHPSAAPIFARVTAAGVDRWEGITIENSVARRLTCVRD